MWGGLYSDKVLTKPLLSCQAPYLAQRGFPCRCAEKTVGPQGFSAAPSDSELNHIAVARGKVGILRAAALEGSSSVLCWRKKNIHRRLSHKEIHWKIQRPESVHSYRSNFVTSFSQNERGGKYVKKSKYSFSTFFQTEIHLLWKLTYIKADTRH